ncbi:MAG TPA: transcriptional regulator [Lachnospiraceae bacterium]|nr:transcriptional regulator [Lachnospiraceae bacterium]
MEKLWDNSPRTIMQLYHSLEEEPGWSKSTVNTLLSRMLEKGIIYYEEGERARQYYPAIRREDAAVAETESLIRRVYKGSVSMMMSTMLKKNALSEEEREELYQILRNGE